MHHKHDHTSSSVAILTLSDTRNLTEDKSGTKIEQLLSPLHTIVDRKLIKDDPLHLRAVLTDWIQDERISIIITTGGTGISERDTTYSIVEQLIETPIHGFGELFRFKSYEEIGARAMLSNAIAGTTNQTAIFSLPGSVHAVTLAMTELILPTINHVSRELIK